MGHVSELCPKTDSQETQTDLINDQIPGLLKSTRNGLGLVGFCDGLSSIRNQQVAGSTPAGGSKFLHIFTLTHISKIVIRVSFTRAKLFSDPSN